MSTGSAKIFVTRRLPAPVEARLEALFDVHLNPDDTAVGGHNLVTALEGFTVLVSTITDRLDAGLIEQLPQSVKLIAQFGNGTDNIDIQAAKKRGIVVTNTPSVLTEDTADLAMAHILAGPRRLVEGANVLPEFGQWSGWSPTWMLGRRLAGKALGIVGMGRIGTAVARRAHAFGLEIHYHSRTRRAPQIEEPVKARFWNNLDDMLAAVDIVSLHTPHTKDTFNLLNEERLKLMKRDGFLVNVSRPELVDEDALIGLIEGGHLGGAGLDVFEHPRTINPRLIELARTHRVVLTPHMASATLEGRVEMGETVMVNIKVFLDGHNPPHRVLP